MTKNIPRDHLLLDRSPHIGLLISRWELDKFKNCWNEGFWTSKILTLLYQQFSNLLISQWGSSGPRLGALSNNRWSGGSERRSYDARRWRRPLRRGCSLSCTCTGQSPPSLSWRSSASWRPRTAPAGLLSPRRCTCRPPSRSSVLQDLFSFSWWPLIYAERRDYEDISTATCTSFLDSGRFSFTLTKNTTQKQAYKRGSFSSTGRILDDGL